MTQVTGILLAAGLSRRFGGNKLLHNLPNGLPVVIQAVRALREVLPHTIVVVNAQDWKTRELLETESVHVICNDDAHRGMGTSIACGVGESLQADGWVIALADMPYMRAATIHAVAAGIRHPGTICAPQYGKERGHPVGFGRAYAEALIQLSADEGARQIIATNRECLELFQTDDRGVVMDIDSRQDVRTVCTLAR